MLGQPGVPSEGWSQDAWETQDSHTQAPTLPQLQGHHSLRGAGCNPEEQSPTLGHKLWSPKKKNRELAGERAVNWQIGFRPYP